VWQLTGKCGYNLASYLIDLWFDLVVPNQDMSLDELNLSLAAVRIPCAAAVKDGASEFEAGLTGDSG